jgi:cell division protease FtsH
MDRILKNIAFWTVIVLAILFFYKFLQTPSTASDLMDSIRFTEALRAGNIARVTLPPDAILGGDLGHPGPDGKAARFLIATPEYRDLVDDLLRQNVTVEFRSPRDSTLLTTALSWIPMLFIIGVWIYFMRTMQAARRRSESQPGAPIGP